MIFSKISENELVFHFNASLTAVNLAKYDWVYSMQPNKTPFSMANYKTFFNNTLKLDRFICRFAINPSSAKNQKIVKELLEGAELPLKNKRSIVIIYLTQKG